MGSAKFKILLLALIFAGWSSANAEFGFSIGLSTPNDKINDIYNSDRLDVDSIADGTLFREGAKSGYHILVKARFELSEKMVFFGGIGIHRFPQTKLLVKDPNNPNITLAELYTNQNIVPITAGLNAYLFKDVIGIYGVGDLSYNYISSSVDIETKGIELPYSTTPSESRVGFGLGAGIDFDISLLKLNLEAKYNYTNLIGKTDGEGDKSYFTLGLGVFF